MDASIDVLTVGSPRSGTTSPVARTPSPEPVERVGTSADARDVGVIKLLQESYRSRPHGIFPRLGHEFFGHAGPAQVLERIADVLFPDLVVEDDAPEATAALLEGWLSDKLPPLRRLLETQLGSINTMLARDMKRTGRTYEPMTVAPTVQRFLRELPALRAALIGDIQAICDNDPAATLQSWAEVLVAYPGSQAMLAHRVAHALHLLQVPVLPRMLSNVGLRTTGADIHPAASIGANFCFDHCVGTVIGETARIGAGVVLHHGITLGATSTPRDVHGAVLRGAQRHPTLGDGVVVGAHASVLGDITIGANTTIGAHQLVTRPVAQNMLVTSKGVRAKR